MSDTPTGETEPDHSPAEGPVEPAAAPEPAAAGATPVVPTPAEPPAASADATAAEPVTAGAVTPEPVATEPAAVPVAAPPPPPKRRGGILVPMWAAIVAAVLLIGGLGFAIGYWTSDGGDGSESRDASSGQVAPNDGGRGNGNGNGNNGNANGSGNGSGQTIAPIAFLGVSLENAPNNGGARVADVQAGSPAAQAGLKTGDVITKVGDTTVTNAADLLGAIRSQKPGDTITVTYTRDGTSAQAKVTLATRPTTRSAVTP